MQLRMTYEGVDEFLRDHEEQIARGGLSCAATLDPGSSAAWTSSSSW